MGYSYKNKLVILVGGGQAVNTTDFQPEVHWSQSSHCQATSSFGTDSLSEK